MTARSTVATAFTSWAPIMMGFLRIRSATTPPHSENTNDGSMNERITQVSAIGEAVMS